MFKPKKNKLYSIFFVYAWLLLTVGIVMLSIAGVYFYGLAEERIATKLEAEKLALESETTITALDNNPQVQGVQTVVETNDGRPAIIAKFLERHRSPMKPYDYYGEKLVEIADRYKLDFRLLPSIAMQESGICKNTHTDAPHNCLGFGIHEQGTLDFESYEAGFERAGRELRAYYIDQGRITPEAIMRKYTPSSNGSWADSVNQWMAEMRYDDRQKGRESTEDANVLEFVPEEAGE